MKVALVLALLGLPALAECKDCCSPLKLAASYTFGQKFSLPAVEAGAVLCKVSSVDTWECVDSAAVANGVVTQGTSTTYVDTFAGAKAINDVTGTTAPVWDLGSLNLFAGDFTVMAAGYPTGASGATLVWFDASNLYIRSESGSLFGRFGSTGTRPALTGPPVDGWAVVTARKKGTLHTIRSNGTNGTPQSYTDDIPGTLGPMHFGEADNSGGPMRGPLAWVYLVPRALSDAEVGAIEMRWFGSPPELVYSNGFGCVDSIDTTGFIDCFAGGAPMVNARGLYLHRAINNRWATDPMDLASTVDVGTPVITSNVANGPFSRWHNAAEVDRLVDDDAAACEGKQSVYSVGASPGPATLYCYLAAGDTGTVRTKVRLRVVTDGTGSVSCDFADLTAAYGLRTCTAVVGGSPTYIYGQVLEGNVASDTGSVLVDFCQLNASAWVEPPYPFGNSLIGASTQRLDISASDITAGGKFEMVFTPVYDTNSPLQWLGATSILYLWDATPASGGHYAVFTMGNTLMGHLHSFTSDGLHDATVDANGIGLVPNRLHGMSMEWTGSGSSCLTTDRLNPCYGVIAGCTAQVELGRGVGQCPLQPKWFYLGNRYSGEYPSTATVAAVRVYTP